MSRDIYILKLEPEKVKRKLSAELSRVAGFEKIVEKIKRNPNDLTADEFARVYMHVRDEHEVENRKSLFSEFGIPEIYHTRGKSCSFMDELYTFFPSRQSVRQVSLFTGKQFCLFLDWFILLLAMIHFIDETDLEKFKDYPDLYPSNFEDRQWFFLFFQTLQYSDKWNTKVIDALIQNSLFSLSDELYNRAIETLKQELQKKENGRESGLYSVSGFVHDYIKLRKKIPLDEGRIFVLDW